MGDSSRDERLLALARRLLDGGAIDWDREGIAETEVREGMKRLERIVGRVGCEPETETSPPPPRDRSDRFIGDFRLVRKLGEGGMGVVYEAEQQHPKRPVALKVIRGGAHVSPDTLKLFRREIQTLARLNHSGIAQLHEAGVTDDGMHFFVMELVRGVPLSDWLRSRPKGPITPAEMRIRLSLFRKICDAVAYAHQKGVIHRDLKPGNVLIPKPVAGSSMQDAVPEVKILDFGLARITDSDVQATTFITEMGKVQGTLPYMSPEQVRGNPDEIDLRTDVYALGVMLYEMVTGHLPYDLSKAQIPEAVRIICEEAPRSLTSTFTGTRRLDADVATIAGKCLEKESARRYQSAAALGEDVQRYLTNQPILARPPSAAYQFRKLVSRHKGPFAAAAAAFILLAVFAAAMTLQAARIARERDRANQEADTARRVSGFLEQLFQVANPEATRSTEVSPRELLDSAADQLDLELKDEPRVRGRLMSTLVDVYKGLGMFDRAEPLSRRALALTDSLYGANSLEYADALDAVGGHDNNIRAHAIRSGLLSPDDPRLARGLYLLGSYAVFNDLPNGESTLLRALALTDKAKLPADRRLRLFILNELGVSRAKLQDFTGSLDYLRRAQAIREEILHPKHRDRIEGRMGVGYLLLLTGDSVAARPLLETALADAEKALGPDHRSVGMCASSLGELERREGHFDRANPLLERSIAIFERIDPSGAWLSEPYTGLGLIAESRGQLNLALEDFRRARAALSHGTGTVVLDPNPEYVRVLRKVGRVAEAERVEASMPNVGSTPARR